MEKLQIALEKARAKRDGAGDAPATPDRRAARAKPADKPGSDPWLTLTELQLDPAHLLRKRIVSYDGGPEASPFDLLRTKILLQMRKSGWTRLAVTSPQTGCGKTTAATNLALGFRRQTEKRVALFEMDMRRPAIARALGQSPEQDAAKWLQGEVGFAEHATRVGKNILISYNARPSRDPAHLLMSDHTGELLDEFESLYNPDLMIFDLPPMMASDDTTAFLKNVDCALIFAGAEMTTIAQVDSCERDVAEHTNVMGVVLNKCRFPDDDSGYGYNNYY
ncbi:MAG: CpsD/CapB family tyrosine-protein kinase [Rhodobacteraceae bacterium]|nr:CpsD/CapB family tyrosine-protein kinase [Paracoccaceae bacterium]